VSLLHRGTETVTVFPEETFTDADGNTRTRPSFVGVVVRAVVQPMTSTEHQTVGFETESKYRVRLVGYSGVLGAQSQVDWKASGTPSTEIPGSTTALAPSRTGEHCGPSPPTLCQWRGRGWPMRR